MKVKTIIFGERIWDGQDDGLSLCQECKLRSSMIHPGLAALKYWDRGKYAAGYGARFSEIPDSETAHHCWRCGWEDADTEALESARHKRVLAEGREDHFEDTWGNLFDSGEEARANGIPFDEERTEPWKEGWIAVDINLGVLAERDWG